MRTETTPLIRLDVPRFRYKPALDGMRGIGVLIVMFYHYGGNIWLHGGPILIDLFFVLSAFLITNLLLDEVHKDGAINIRGFYYRRVLRLFPAMYALLIVVGLLALVVAVTGSEEIPRSVWAEIAAVALYVYNFFLAFAGFGSGDEPRFLLHLWTLSMEEWFYFAWPFALIWGLRRVRNQRRLLIGCAVFIAFWISVRVGAGFAGLTLRDAGEVEDYAYPLQVLLRFSIMRPDSLVVGCLAAIASRSMYPLTPRSRQLLGYAGAGAGIWMLVVMFGGGRFEFLDPFSAVGYNLAILGLAPFIIWVNYTPESRLSGVLSWPVWLWLGTRSYGIYIWHEIPNGLIPAFGVSNAAMLARTVVLSAISIGIAELSWRFIETPFLRRKQKRFTSIAGR